MQIRQEKLDRLPEEVSHFIEGFSTLQIASVDEQGNPHASYAPFTRVNGQFVMLLSDVSRHARNLKQQQKASLMLIESETDAKHLFARKRLTLDCQTSNLDKESDAGQALLQQLETKFGDIVGRLKVLEDFNLFTFTPEQAVYVKGFGQAFNLNGDLNQVKHLTEGHRAKKGQQAPQADTVK